VRKPTGWKYADTNGEPPRNEMIRVEGGSTIIGKPKESDTYGWDNEFGHEEVTVQPFEASKFLITNSEYLEFYNAGGFNNKEFWSDEGWEWKLTTNTIHPKFWVPTDTGMNYRLMFDEIPLPLDFPVEVNQFEAHAYCRWKGEGIRLLTEPELHIIGHDQLEIDCTFSEQWNLNMKFGSPTPVGHFGENSLGFADLFGNVWERLDQYFYPLPGFKIHFLYENYSEPYFDNEHTMMLGGCWASSGTSASRYYRNWFRKYFYQHAGFRIARTLTQN